MLKNNCPTASFLNLTPKTSNDSSSAMSNVRRKDFQGITRVIYRMAVLNQLELCLFNAACLFSSTKNFTFFEILTRFKGRSFWG